VAQCCTHDHAGKAQDAAANYPSGIAYTSSGGVWPGYFGDKGGCNVAEGNNAFRSSCGYKVKGGRKNDNVEDYKN
jgi:hypothetical protein